MDVNRQLVMISFFSAEYKRAHAIRDAIAESLIKNSYLAEEEQE
jgi:hypothetical protein